ncbi:MAG: hypothetical protein ACR2P1_09185 [Pseudomonadales bacterium]
MQPEIYLLDKPTILEIVVINFRRQLWKNLDATPHLHPQLESSKYRQFNCKMRKRNVTPVTLRLQTYLQACVVSQPT